MQTSPVHNVRRCLNNSIVYQSTNKQDNCITFQHCKLPAMASSANSFPARVQSFDCTSKNKSEHTSFEIMTVDLSIAFLYGI